MKKTIKKDGNKIRLTVTLSKEEMQSDKLVAFSYRDAKVYMKEKKYDIKSLLEQKLVVNKGMERNNKGEFVFLLKETPKPAPKPEVKAEAKRAAEPSKKLETPTSPSPTTTRTTSRRATNTRKKKND